MCLVIIIDKTKTPLVIYINCIISWDCNTAFTQVYTNCAPIQVNETF